MGTRNLLTLLFILVTFLGNAQAEHMHGAWCGTHELSPFQNTWLKAFQERLEEGHASYRSSRSVINVPISVHIVGDDNGSGYYELEDLFYSICKLNENYEEVGMYFYLSGDIQYIDNSSYYEHDYSAGYQMMYYNNVDSAINIYFCKQAVEGNCGYYSPSGNAVAISNGCQLRDATTLTHELGHYLSLPHTFSGWEGRSYDENPVSTQRQERQDGSNCRWAADGFCDTPPDYISDRWSCPYNAGYTDPAGDEIETDGSLYMSYSNDACQSKFSEEQMEAMVAYVTENRTDLMPDETPEYKEDLGAAELLLPLDNDYRVPENYVAMAWEPMDDVEWYHLQVTNHLRNFNVLMIDTLVQTNYAEFTSGFEFDKSYKFRVRPISKMNTCSDFSEEREFAIYTATTNPDTSWNIWKEPVYDTANNVNELVKAETALRFYPNPTDDQQTIWINNPFQNIDASTLSIFNLNGQVVYQQELNSNEDLVKVSSMSWNKGVYFIELRNGSQTYQNKVMVQ